ncbi:MAG: alkyl hydroperoxide reductase [Bacteroidetes bacterium HGW-Bacteroidetes-16]|jgi:peroxiredoxin|nr:MAG: alkyl hydroperoxide reductase [Bacteroidetes bacterium HGW-Bacteroidetes-16]
MSAFKTIAITFLIIIFMNNATSQTTKKVEEANGLCVGVVAPAFEALDANGHLFTLERVLKAGPVVIIFYRGFWCPVCNKHLGAIQDSLKMIEKSGVKVIAISPEKPEYLDKMAEKTGAEFTLLYDEGYQIAKAYDVNFAPDKMQLFTYNVVLGGKLKETHSDDTQQLPIPATYIVNQDGMITWRQFDRDYKNRSSVKDILTALEELKQADK